MEPSRLLFPFTMRLNRKSGSDSAANSSVSHRYLSLSSIVIVFLMLSRARVGQSL
jgi:hypothetical protein